MSKVEQITIERVRIHHGWLYITTMYKTTLYKMENTPDYTDKQPILMTTTIEMDHRGSITEDIGKREMLYDSST